MLSNNWVSCLTKVKFTFADGTTYETTGNSNLRTLSVKKSIANVSSNPIGTVSANTVTMEIADTESLFAINNSSSPYYGKLKQGFTIETYSQIDGGSFEKTGEYKMVDKQNTTKPGYKASFKGMDSIGFILQRKSNVKYILSNISALEYITNLLVANGISINRIHVSSDLLTKTIKYAYTFGDKIIDILNEFCTAFMCCIYTDNNGDVNIKTLNSLKQADSVFTISGNVNLYGSSAQDGILSGFNAIKITYNKPTLDYRTNIVNINNITLANGTTNFKDYAISNNAYVNGIDYIRVSNKTNNELVYADNVETTQQKISFEIVSESTEDISSDINVYANVVNKHEVFISEVVDGLYITEDDDNKIKYYNLNSEIMQLDEYATELKEQLKLMGNTEIVYITAKTKGNPLLEVGSVVNYSSEQLKFTGTCLIVDINASYGGSQSFDVVLLNIDSIQ